MRLRSLEQGQHVLGAFGRPERQPMMIGVLERTAAPYGDEPGVAFLGQDHWFVPGVARPI